MAQGIPRDYKYASPDRYELLRELAHKNRHNPTDAEYVLWQQIKGKAFGVKFRRQYIVGDYIADFICLDKKIIIEVDGGYHFLPDQMEEDRIRSEIIERHGFTIVRFTNEQVLYDTAQQLTT